MSQITGFTAGAFDMFHYGHLNFLKNAKLRCQRLIVGVNSDELIHDYKDKDVIIRFEERLAIVKAIRYVDEVIRVDSLDKLIYWKQLKFDKVFIGSDWKNHPRWIETTRQMSEIGVLVEFLDYTDGISTTEIRNRLCRS